jgi:transcriptional regulator with PAS, ATPase and Fis domain|tara:strand:- start:224 stop:559 length:336 start_codon:yes stop_codon:yes gene_type:complete
LPSIYIFIIGVKIFTPNLIKRDCVIILINTSTKPKAISMDEQQFIWEELEKLWPSDGKVGQTLVEELEELEMKRIKLALDQAKNNKTHASKELGIGRTLLIHKCKKYGLVA